MRTVLAWGTSWRWVSHQGGYLEVSTIGSRPSLSRKLYSLLGPRAFARWKRSQPQRHWLFVGWSRLNRLQTSPVAMPFLGGWLWASMNPRRVVPDLDSPTTKITFAMTSILPEISTQKFMSDSNFVPKAVEKFALSRRLLNRYG